LPFKCNLHRYDTSANLTISSPLEANKSHNIVFAVAALDSGLDNPVFAAIELDYADADQDSTGESAAEVGG
jgi:splicing factor 3B subunit 3